MLLQFLTRAAGYVKGPLFERMFRTVNRRVGAEWGISLPRRLTLKVPTYGRSMGLWVTRKLYTLFTEGNVPPALKLWLRRTICVVPIAPKKTAEILHKARTPRVMPDIISYLRDTPHITMPDHRIRLLCEPLPPESITHLSELACARTQEMGCDCTRRMHTHPCLRNPLGHVILRSPQQFQCVAPGLTDLFTEHARTPLLPASDAVHTLMPQVRRQLLQALLPVPMPTGCTPLTHPDPDPPSPLPLMSVADVDHVIHEILQHCDREAHARAPWLRHEHMDTIQHIMKHLELVGDTWDKKLHRMHACCTRLQDQQTISMIICGEKFVIQGWGSSPNAGQQWTLLHILHTARTQGILHRAARHMCLPHVLLNADTTTEWVRHNYTHPTHARHTPTRLPRVPTAYGKLKWKTQELLTVSYASLSPLLVTPSTNGAASCREHSVLLYGR